MVNFERDNVAIYRAPTFPKERNELGFPSEGTPGLMNSGTIAIDLNL